MTGRPVLGINFGTHDAAAAVVADGRVLAAAEEERFSRVKHTRQLEQVRADMQPWQNTAAVRTFNDRLASYGLA